MERMYIHADDVGINQTRQPVISASDINMDSENPAYTDKRYVSTKKPIGTGYIKSNEQKAHRSKFITGEAFDPKRYYSSQTADAKGGAGLTTVKLTGRKRPSRKTARKLGEAPLKIHSENWDPMSKYIW